MVLAGQLRVGPDAIAEGDVFGLAGVNEGVEGGEGRGIPTRTMPNDF
jgi:hypothetical protein